MRKMVKQKKVNNKHKIYDDNTIVNMKKYYSIDDHTDLLRFIKKHGIVNDDKDENPQQIISS